MDIAKINDLTKEFPLNLVKKGVVIFCPFRDNEKVYYIQEGFIKVYRLTKNNHELTLCILSSGMFFPFNKIVEEWSSRFFYSTIGDSVLKEIPTNKFNLLLFKFPDLKSAIHSEVLKYLNLISTNLEDCVFCNSLNKVISGLNLLALSLGEIENNKVNFKFKITHELVSSLAGISRETATRKLDYLAKKSIIKLEYNHINIIDYSGLKAYTKC